MKIRPVMRGLLTFVPGVQSHLPMRGTRTSVSASYYYGVWLKHLTLLWANGVRSIPRTFAELGPGDALGVGLAALLSGATRYYALDVVRYSNIPATLKVLDEMIELFRTRAPKPAKGFPNVDAYLGPDLFPHHILTEELLARSLAPERIASIREIAEHRDRPGAVSIKYMVPWTDASVIETNSVDLLLSHSVLEHVVDLEAVHRSIHRWLKPNGVMSHQIDFTAHGLSSKWNGYRAYSELLWKFILGRRPFLINREPCSAHELHVKNQGFDLICSMKNYRRDGIQRSELSRHWKDISDDDLICCGAFIQARKPPEATDERGQAMSASQAPVHASSGA
ncbi:MAG TPA: methyltransferase domain-containing protein [Methylomirabilota bacterium]|jgi:hypothetical protein